MLELVEGCSGFYLYNETGECACLGDGVGTEIDGLTLDDGEKFVEAWQREINENEAEYREVYQLWDDSRNLYLDWADRLSEATGRHLTVDEVEVVVGLSQGVAFFLHSPDTDSWWTAYYNQAAGDMCCKGSDDADYIKECFEYRGCELQDGGIGEDGEALYCPCEQCEVDRDPEEWLDGMLYATDWEHWNWVEYKSIPTVY